MINDCIFDFEFAIIQTSHKLSPKIALFLKLILTNCNILTKKTVEEKNLPSFFVTNEKKRHLCSKYLTSPINKRGLI